MHEWPGLRSVAGVADMWTAGGRDVSLSPRLDPDGPTRVPSSRYPPASHHPADTAADDPREVLDLPEGGVAGPHLVLDLLDAVQGRRVVAPPKISPILTSESPVHSRIRYIAMCRACVRGRERRLRHEVGGRQREVRRRLLQDQRRRDLVLGLGDQVLQRPLGELDVDRLAA